MQQSQGFSTQLMGFSTPSGSISCRSLPAHASLRSVLPSVQHPLRQHQLPEPPRSRLAALSLAVGSAPPPAASAAGASPLTPRCAQSCRRFSTPSGSISCRSLPAHASLRSVLPSVQHPLRQHQLPEPPRSRLAALSLAVGSAPPPAASAAGASPLTPRCAQSCRRFSTPSGSISCRSLPAHASLRSVLPSVQHPLRQHQLPEPPRSRLAALSLAVGSAPPPAASAAGASPLTPRCAQSCRRFSTPSGSISCRSLPAHASLRSCP